MITSTSNQQMKNLTLLMKKAKARNEQGVFVAEGRKMFLEAPVEWVKQVYVSESFYGTCTQGNMQDCMESCTPKHGEEKLNRKVLERLNETGYEIVSDNVFKSVSDTQTPQGILCLVRMPQYPLSDLLRGNRTHLLIVESIQDPGNLGTMLRTGEGAGITGIIMNRTTVDLFNPKTIRSTMGSIYRVPYYIADDLAETIGELKRQKVGIYAAHLKGQMQYDEPSYCKGTAFLIGNEGNGLSDEIAGLADTYVRIPMEGSVESLNAAVSAALLMYETNRQRRRNGK